MSALTFRYLRSVGLVALLCVGLGLTGCSSLPKHPVRVDTFSMQPAEDGLLKDTSQAVCKDLKEGESAFLLLDDGQDALEWRLAMIDHAAASIDMKYFIWEGDEVGHLMLARIIKAAGRGIRVRLLVDDMTLKASDKKIALLSSIENIEFRIYNAAKGRGLSGWFSFIGDSRLNQRMHNKMLMVDGQWAVLGGRNIGNSYYGLSAGYNFRDLDVLTTGHIMPELANAFDEYWNSLLAFPGDQIKKIPMGKSRQKLLTKMGKSMQKSETILRYTPFPIERADWSTQWAALPGTMVAGTAEYYHDAPDIEGAERLRMLDVLATNQPPVTTSAVYVSPYFLPSTSMLEGMQALGDRGVDVSLVTTSLGSNNHTPVHSHYKKYRRRILATGTDLYEFDHEPSAEVRQKADTTPIASGFISMHVKASIFDGDRVMIGSLNLDPRAMVLNTENVLVIHSKPLADQIMAMVNELTAPGNAWRVTRENGKMRWRSGDAKLKKVPARSGWQRFGDFFYRWLPIESQL